jgi:hypothetical protein
MEELDQAEANNQGLIIEYADSYRLSFSGEWEEDVKIKGVFIDRDGDKYEGQLKNNKRHGKGV